MATLTTRATIKAYLQANWSSAPIVYENEPIPRPEPPSPWLMIEMVGNIFEQSSIGSGHPTTNRWIEEGYLLAHVHVPLGTGDTTASGLAEGLANTLRGVVLPGDLRLQNMSIGAGDPGADIGPWWRLTVRADFRRG